jgi:hypothetical protein
MQQPGREVVLPTTGEVVDLGNPGACAAALDAIREMEDVVKGYKRLLTGVLIEESTRVGSKTLHFGGVTVEIKESVTTHWDLEILETLLEAGLPSERYDELVKAEVTYKVNKTESKRIAAANPAYAEIIDRACKEEPARIYASVVAK